MISKDNNLQATQYIPGSLTDYYHQHESYDQLVAESKKEKEIIAPSSRGLPKSRDDFSWCPEPPKPDLKREAEEVYEKHREMLTATYRPPRDYKPPVSEEDLQRKALMDAVANFNLAKKLHKENLEHEPLPDTITNALYRKIQMEKSGEDPGMALPEANYATGIGWKGYPGYGPTRCTKMKVFRPKTSHHVKQEKRDGRPNSVSSFDKTWRFIKQSKVSPIDLAICWDMSPVNPADEPKPPTHIDGSNGSLAPAVFSLVHSDGNSGRSSRSSSKDPLFSKVSGRDVTKEALPFLDRPKTGSCSSGSSLKSRAKSALNLSRIDEACQCNLVGTKEVYRSNPNITEEARKKCTQRRVCGACELKKVPKREEKKKEEYKMAFKAGVPQRTVSNGWKLKFSVKVPKPIYPYKNGNRQDYPEHWRLATVYQQSYKPIHLRKRPLMASIFK